MNKNEDNDKKLPIFSLEKAWNDSVKEHFKNHSDIREKLNREKSLLLTKNKEFIKDIKEARKKLKIPLLRPTEDRTSILIDPDSGKEAELSGYVYGKSEWYQKRFDKAIVRIREKYKLPAYFEEWVEQTLLYGKIPKHYPKTYWGLPFYAIDNPESAFKHGMTRLEKKFVIKMIILKMEIYGKTDSENYKKYKRIITLAKKSRNFQKPIKNLDLAIKLLKKPRMKEKFDEVEGKMINEKFTYDDFTQELHDKDLTPKTVKKISSNMRKKKERILAKIT